MARRVRTRFRKLPKDVYNQLVETKKMTSTSAYNKLKKKKIKPVTPLSKVKALARKASKKSGIPIRVTTNMGNEKYADGIAVRKNNKIEARIHPIVKYYDQRYVKDVIGHEIDHAKVMRKQIK